MWLLKRADGMSLEAFRDWWLSRHAHDVARHQEPYLLRYVVNVRRDDSGLGGKPADDHEWDGVAEQWFADRIERTAEACGDLPEIGEIIAFIREDARRPLCLPGE
jgi:hypothetical protein